MKNSVGRNEKDQYALQVSETKKFKKSAAPCRHQLQIDVLSKTDNFRNIYSSERKIYHNRDAVGKKLSFNLSASRQDAKI